MAHGDTPHGSGPAFDVVLRGYDRRQVDDHIAALESRLSSTSNQSHELRLQRDAAASRAGELEHRLGGAGGPSSGPPTSPVLPTQAPSAPMDDVASLDGLGAKVESILRVATEQAAAIRRSAENAGRMHAEAEVRLRATFEGIAERLHPLVGRLDEESSTAKAAVTETTDEATALQTAARQQADAMVAAASVAAARMRKDAESRVDFTVRQVADVREELALVRQILDSLQTPSPVPGAAGSAPGAAPETGAPGADGETSGADGGPPGADGPADATGPLQVADTARPAGSGQGGGSSLAARLTKPVGSFPGNGQPASAGRGAHTESESAAPPSAAAGGPRGAVDLQPPTPTAPPPRWPGDTGAAAAAASGSDSGTGVSSDSPTETIALPRLDSGPGQRDAEAARRRQPPS